jgi:DNA-binding phage protein
MKRSRNPIAPAVTHEGWLLKHLRDPELAAEYPTAALAEGDQAAFMLAVRDVGKARSLAGQQRKRHSTR